ncbi:DUF1311 domain-containing protein [Mucilaginibacter sp. HMF5004]|uniref:DUF1311 domain-containing protein n=1 Tax=Mucilaginibacter rivuli TaxID=2857527 RepID=UPI001C600C60|nr:DUF1311 domain-containing protein [Mucilaginibacter rivuli]MBW4891456.1 DUF1311 domain-containing protein [Mucilaginibacter rivuli]
MQKLRIIVALLLCFWGLQGFAQTIKTVDSLRNSYQTCLDKGVYMLGCSKVHYHQIDSMLNLAYIKLRTKLLSPQISKLKSEQAQWLIKRDQYFKNLTLDPEVKSLGGEDREMVLIDKKATFVEERVIVLLRRL